MKGAFFPARGGFTLIELLVGTSLLAIAFLGLGAVVPNLVSSMARSEVDFLGANAVDDRLEMILMDPRYPLLDSIYRESGVPVPYLPGGSRTTQVTRVVNQVAGGRTLDQTTITVTVETEAPERTFSGRVVVGAP